MTEMRTPEQVEADDALTAAIEAVNRAYYPDDGPRLLTDYLVLFVQQAFDEDGDTTAYGTVPRDGELAVHRQLGLLEHASTRLRQRIGESEPL